MCGQTFGRHNGGMPELVHPAQLDPRLADLERPQHTGFTGGLCRALAQRWQVDPLVVRLVAVALTFAGGVGVAMYIWGCLLTPRVGGTPPVLRWIPGFGRWRLNTQMLVVAISSLVLVLSIARTTGIGWGPIIVVGALAWALSRKRRRNTESSPTQSPTPAAQETHTSVEQWRSRLSPHTGEPLPTVDLYAPEPTAPHSSGTAPSRRPRSWPAAAIIVLLAAGAAAVPFVLGLDSAVLWAGVAANGTAAILILLHTVLLRSRRLPIALLIVALVSAVGTGLLVVADSRPVELPYTSTDANELRYEFFGEAPAELDLTDLDVDEPRTVTIDATASVVQVTVKANPAAVTLLSDTIAYDTTTSGTRSYTTSQLDLVITGSFSVIDIEVVP